MDERRRPNPKLRLAVLITAICVVASMVFAMSTSLAHNAVERPLIEVSQFPRLAALDIGASDFSYISKSRQEAGLARLVEAKQPLFCGGTKPYATISFDDGPSKTTPQLIKLLKHAGVSATWLDLGKNASDMTPNLRLQSAYGPIGNHSWDHANFTTLSTADLKTQLADTQETIQQGTGQDWKMMRPPYGARNPQTERIIRKLGYAELLWSADSQDALSKPWRTIAENAINGLGPGAVILFHDGPAATLTALKRKVLPAIEKSGLTMVTLPELMVINPPSAAQLNAGPMGCSHAGKVNVSGSFPANSEVGYAR